MTVNIFGVQRMFVASPSLSYLWKLGYKLRGKYHRSLFALHITQISTRSPLIIEWIDRLYNFFKPSLFSVKQRLAGQLRYYKTRGD